MDLHLRPYQGDEDYWRLRAFLRHVLLANGRREFSWAVARWDYWWWFANPHLEHISLEENVFLWETPGGEIAAALNPEGHGQVFLHVHPAYCSVDLYAEMLTLAEERLAVTGQDGRRKLWAFADSQDSRLHRALLQRGFQRVERPGEQEYQHRRSLDGWLPEVPATPGYVIRPLGGGLELLERCYASGLGFHEDDIAVARNNRDDPSWYRSLQSAPLYRRDLDLVAVAADGAIAAGAIAAFTTIWFDDVTRTAYFEPVATVPAHRRRGLAQALMITGLHRLQRMGCLVAFVGGYSERANALYFSVMGPEYDVSEPWEKVIE